jgi:chemotaxis protein MotB
MRTATPTLRAFAAGVTLATSACIPQGTYDDAVSRADTAAAQCKLAAQRAEASAKSDRERVENLNVAVQAANARLVVADAREKALLQKVDEEAVLTATLRGELARTGENEVFYKGLAVRLKSIVDTGDLSIVVRGGRMVLRLPNDVLFDSGSSDLKPAGRKTLALLATVLASVPGRRFQVSGHTDTMTIQTAQFPSNWELSTARAVQVVRFLVVSGGLPAARLSAAGYGEFDPVVPNATPADRARNRRIEIAIQPDIREVVAVPDRY